MSCVFAVGDDHIWNPGLRTGMVYIEIATSIAGQPEFAGMPIGLTAMASDYYHVESAVFADFIRAVLGSSVMRNQPYRALVFGFVVVSLVLLDRAGVSIEPLDESQRDLFDAKADVAEAI